MAWYDLGWAYDSATGKTKREGEELDAKLERLNREAVASGRRDQAWYEQAEANRVAGVQSERALGTVGDAFLSGWGDGVKNLFRPVGTLLGTTLFSIPAWVWLIAGLAAFTYFGGWKWIKRKA